MKLVSIFMTTLVCLAIFSTDTNAQRRGRGTKTTETPVDSTQKTNFPQGRTKKQPTEANISSDQQGNIDKLKQDLNAVKSGSTVTQEQKDALRDSIYNLAEGTTKPDKAMVQTLANDLAQSIADGNLSNQEKTKLANDLQKVLNSANISVDELNAVIADAKSILEASNIDKNDVETIVNDLKAIANTAKGNLPKRRGKS